MGDMVGGTWCRMHIQIEKVKEPDKYNACDDSEYLITTPHFFGGAHAVHVEAQENNHWIYINSQCPLGRTDPLPVDKEGNKLFRIKMFPEFKEVVNEHNEIAANLHRGWVIATKDDIASTLSLPFYDCMLDKRRYKMGRDRNNMEENETYVAFYVAVDGGLIKAIHNRKWNSGVQTNEWEGE